MNILKITVDSVPESCAVCPLAVEADYVVHHNPWCCVVNQNPEFLREAPKNYRRHDCPLCPQTFADKLHETLSAAGCISAEYTE